MPGVAAEQRSQFVSLMRQYNRRLFRLARAALRDDSEAEDVLQTVYLSAFLSMDQFRGDAALSTWLSRLVLNECFGRLRRNARRQKVIPLTGTHEEIDTVAERDSERPDQLAGRAQIRALLEQKLDQLPDAFRMVFVLRSVEELSVEDTAQYLDIPEATVRSRHFRAKSLLRDALEQEFDIAERDLFEFGGNRCDRIISTVLSRLEKAVAARLRDS